MGIALDLSSLAFGPVVEAACQVIGAKAGERLAVGVVNLLSKRFSDHSARLIRALDQAHTRAWHALEIALAGDSFWQRCKLQLASGEDKAFREQVRVFLEAIPANALPVGKEQFRRLCWQELRQARKEGVLALGTPSPEKLAQRAGAFARFRDPQMLLRAEQETLKHLSTAFGEFNYRNLALLLLPREGPSLLVVAVRYFLRRAIEDDAQLFQGLAFAQLEQIQAEQEKGFAALGQLLHEQSDRLESLLNDVAGTVEQTHTAVLDVKEELQNQGQQNRDLYQAVLSLQARFDLLRTELRPRDSLSIRNDAERRLVREVVQRYRLLPDEQRRQQPALLNAIGKLEVAAGAFEDAGRDFAAAAELLPESSARAETHINAYRAALEQHNWTSAQEQLRHALKLDAASFAPFPQDRYRLTRILGAGGSGVAFLCDDMQQKDKVVIKTLLDDSLDCGIDQLFTEAEVLSKLNHPGVVRLRGHGFTDAANRSRPYLVMEFFEGRTLEDYIREEGPLSFGEWLAVARQMAEALLTAHRQKVLHRDLKPANVLIRDGDGGLRIQLIDFGLAMRHDTIRESKRGQSLIGVSIAGTLEYSAPEQLGRLPGVKAGPYSDVFGFGRTSCYALFQTPQPVLKHWQSLPQPMADLLSRCVSETPEERLADFADVMNHLNKVQWDLRARNVLTRAQTAPVAELAPEPARPARSAPPRRRRPVELDEDDEEYEEERKGGLQMVVAGLPVWAWGSIAVGLLLFFISTLIALTAGSNRPAGAAGPNASSPGSSGGGSGGGKGTAPRSQGPRVTEPKEKDPEDRKTYLSDLTEFDLGGFPVFWKLGKKGETGDTWHNKVKADAKYYSKALGMHPPEHGYSTVKYHIEPAEFFQSLAGMDDSASETLKGDFFFEVLGDGQSLWKSTPLRGRVAFQHCRVSVRGVKVLELRVYAPPDASHDGGHAVWLDPYITRPDGYRAAPGKIQPPLARTAPKPPSAESFADLIGYWNLDDGEGTSAANLAGSKLPGHVVNARWIDGIRGKALRIVGGGSGLQYAHKEGISFGAGEPFTIAFWAQTRRDKGTLLSQRNKRTGAPIIDLKMDGGRVTVQVRQDGNEFDRPVEFRGGVVNDGKWHHVALTRDGENLELFLDGALQGRASGASARGSINTDLCALGVELHDFGRGGKDDGPTFQGCVDELCIFRRALKQRDILALAGFDAAYLTDLPELEAGPFPKDWRLGKNGEIGEGKKKIQVDGKEWPKALGLTPPSREQPCAVKYALDGHALKLEAAVAVAESATASSDVFFEVLGDGKSLWKSKAVSRGRPDKCSVDLKGVRELELRTSSDGGTGSHAVWIDPLIRLVSPATR